MATATLKRQWQVANNGGWAESFNFYIGSAATPDDLTGCSAQLNMIRAGRPAAEALTYSSTDATPYLTLSGGAVALSVPDAVTATWLPGAYDIQLRVIPATPGIDRYNLVGSGRLTVVEAPGT